MNVLEKEESKIISIQHDKLKKLLNHTWHHSAFYRNLWSKQGIKESDLDHLSIEDLPFVSKEMLMENFDEVVTHADLQYNEILSFLTVYLGQQPILYKDRYLIIRSSGSSRIQGIFVYDLPSLAVIKNTIKERMYPPVNHTSKKLRYTYLGMLNGNYAGETLARGTPDELYDKLLLSVMSDENTNIKSLNEFLPHIIGGYASSINQLAKTQLQGRLAIQPFHINCGGDPLSDSSFDIIKQAWNCSIYNIYACSESLAGLGVKYNNNPYFNLFDDLVCVEILNKKDKAVAIGESGQVVLTNLYNHAFPIIRYKLNDFVIKGEKKSGYSTIEKIVGRENQHLPITKKNGELTYIHALCLACFFVSPIEEIQFVSHSPSLITIRYQSENEVSDQIRKKFTDLLLEQNACHSVCFNIEKVDKFALDSVSGKKQLVVNYV